MVKNLRDVHDALGLALPVKAAGDMHETAGIGGYEGRGLGLFQVADLTLEEFGGEGAVLDGEDTAETAAVVGFRQLPDLRAANGGQEGTRLAIDTDAAQQVAGGMIGKRPIPAGAEVGNAEVIDEVLGELEGARGERPGARQPDRVLGEELGVIMAEHVSAGAGGDDDIALGLLEKADGVLGDGPGLIAQAGVEVWLAATGLIVRELDAEAEAAENLDDGLTRLRVEGVNEASDEELDRDHFRIVLRMKSH